MKRTDEKVGFMFGFEGVWVFVCVMSEESEFHDLAVHEYCCCVYVGFIFGFEGVCVFIYVMSEGSEFHDLAIHEYCCCCVFKALL